LKNLMENLLLREVEGRIAMKDLPQQLRGMLEAESPLSPSEREKVIAALFSAQWNKSKAAEKLNWSRMTLYRKIAKYHITKTPFGPA
jgi:transcriptional regulator of acetoin/glycerol metabolism